MEYKQTIDLLIKSYKQGTLTQGNCSRCVVGNLIANGLGYKVTQHGWEGKYVSKSYSWHNNLNGANLKLGREQIAATGYTKRQVRKIDEAYEGGAGVLEGLEAAAKVLATIHNAPEKELTNSLKRISRL